MNKTKRILSIIVPSYKTKEYLNYTLITFVCDQLQGKIIVYLIDDGSPDDTPVFLREYEKKYPDFFVYIHKENGGHGSVINYGVHNLVDTKYFMVVDGDDYVDTDGLCVLTNKLYDIDSDIITTNFNVIIKDKKYLHKPYKSEKECNIHIKDVHYQLHNVVYKTKIWKDNNIRLTEKVFYEDNQYCLYPMVYSKSVTYIPIEVYHYLLGTDGQSVNPLSVVAHRMDLLKVLDDIIVFYNGLHDREEYINHYFLQYEMNIYNYYYEFVLYYMRGIYKTYKDLKFLKDKYNSFEFLKKDNKNYSLMSIMFRKTFFSFKSFLKSLIR